MRRCGRSPALDLALDASQAGTWSWNVWTETLEWDNRERALYGFADDVAVSFGECIERVHPEDREVLLDRLKKATLPGSSDFWATEFRIIHPDLGERWLGGMGRIEREAGGYARRMAGINFDITLRKRAEKSLRESEDKYRKLHESMMDGFVRVDMDGRIIEYNRAYQEMLGYSDEELRSLTYIELTPGKWHAMESRLMQEQIFPHGFSVPYEKEYRRKDGTVFPVELRTYVIRDAGGASVSMWAVVRDITERKRAEQTMLEWNQTLERRVAERTAELHQSEARFRQLAEATFEGIVVSQGGMVVDCNPQFAELHGYESAEMIGRAVMDFVAPESRKSVDDHVKEGNDAAYECTGLRKDGSVFPAEARACMRTWQGRQTRVTAMRDLTAMKEAVARLRAQQTELETLCAWAWSARSARALSIRSGNRCAEWARTLRLLWPGSVHVRISTVVSNRSSRMSTPTSGA